MECSKTVGGWSRSHLSAEAQPSISPSDFETAATAEGEAIDVVVEAGVIAELSEAKETEVDAAGTGLRSGSVGTRAVKWPRV